MRIHPGCTSFKGLFSEDVIAHFAFNSFGKNMQKLIVEETGCKSRQTSKGHSIVSDLMVNCTIT